MLRPELMRIFLTVCDTGSFTTTSNVLSLPKTTVTNSIQRLETMLGTRLLQRTTRKVTVTHDGLAFYERCKDLLADIEETESMFQDQGAPISGKVRIDMSVPIAKSVIVPKLPKFLEQYPKLEIELSSTDRRVDLVREGFDFVLRSGNLGDSTLIAKKIGEHSIINCVSPSYIEKYGTPKTLDDLSKHFQVHYSQTFGGKPDGFEYWDGSKFVLHKTKALITVNSTESYKAACMAGLGIIQVALSGVEEQLKAGTLKKILPKYVAESMPVNIVYPQRRHVPRRVRLVMDWVEKEVKSYLK